MRLRTMAAIAILVLVGALSQAGEPKPLSLLERSERADTRFGKVSLHEGKYQHMGWGRRGTQTLGNWRGYLNPYVRP